MAASPATSRKARKQNLSASEISVLTEIVEENLSVLQSKLTNSVTNQRTTAEVREKRKNLLSQPKTEFSGFKKETK